MARRKYYSSRTGSFAAVGYDLPTLKRLFEATYDQLVEEDYLQEAFGYHCVDQDYVPGALGRDIEAAMLRLTKKPKLWPIGDNLYHYSEEDLFDVIEFLFDHVSKPLEIGGFFHSYNGCGWHYNNFDKRGGQERFLDEINAVLDAYGPGYRLSIVGEIEELGEPGLDVLLDAPLPQNDRDRVEAKVNRAVQLFRRYYSSLEDRQTAVRELADVLEFLRPQLKEVLTNNDEADLFNLANNFGIRHNNKSQKTNYDRDIWFRWMFYYYLATIHASLRLIEKADI